MKRITLTQYDGGLPVEIDPDIIAAITELGAINDHDGNRSHSRRTRIDPYSPLTICWLVQETAEQIRAAIANAGGEKAATNERSEAECDSYPVSGR